MNKSFTPEERLLKLIKEGAKVDKEAKDIDSSKESVSNLQRQDVSDSAIQPKDIKADVLVTIRPRTIFTMVNISKMLLFLFIGVFLYTLYDLAVFVAPDFIKMHDGQDIVIVGHTKPSIEHKETTEGKNFQGRPLSFYMQDIEKRNLFESTLAKDSTFGDQAQPEPTKVKLEEIAKSFILKGIIAGQPMQAVIEDTKTQKTYFVTKGENVGGIIIDQISDDRVKIKLGDQTADLML